MTYLSRREAVKASAAGIAALGGAAIVAGQTAGQSPKLDQRDSYTIWLRNIRCWDAATDPEFSVFMPETEPITIGRGISEETRYVQIGPYRVEIKISADDDGITVSSGGNKRTIAMNETVHGSYFFYQDDAERVGFKADGTLKVLGHARGCFDIEW
ncbi:MAG: hypothetical protein DCC68_06550 [Planctomycetota bacterium]|nr:MAG: hypothetical protein DCC68_06550 [Planctomycetota bacterium]